MERRINTIPAYDSSQGDGPNILVPVTTNSDTGSSNAAFRL